MPSERVVRTAGPDPSVTVFPTRGKQVLLTTGAAAFVAIGVAMLLSGRPLLVAVGVVSVVVFGAFGILLVRQLVRGGPAVVIDRRGITDTSSATPAGFVPWAQVSGVGIWEQGGQRIVTVAVRDPDAVLAAARPIARSAMRASMRMSGSPVNIATSALPLTAEQLIAEIEGSDLDEVSG